MLVNKYKYSLNRGLLLKTEPKKKNQIKSYAIVTRNHNTLYDTSIDHQTNTFILYNDHEYLHRQCTLALDATSPHLLASIQTHFLSSVNNLSIFIANDPTNSDELIMDSPNSLLQQTFTNIQKNISNNSEICLSIVGVKNENLLTDSFFQFEGEGDDQRAVRLKHSHSSFSKYKVQNVTKYTISDINSLHEALQQYKHIRSQKEYSAIAQQKLWDWLQAELFIFEEINFKEGQSTIIKSHYLLRVNHYLQNTSSLMLQLGILLRKIQEPRSGVDSKQTKLFKILSNCSNSPNNTHLFLQVGHHSSLKQEYLSLVPTAQTTCSKNHLENISFLYIKNYENYPKIASFLSKLNPSNKRPMSQGPRIRSFARGTLSSVEKRRLSSIQQEFQESQEPENRDLQDIIQQAKSLYRESADRRSFYKPSNRHPLRKQKIATQTLNAKPASFIRSDMGRLKTPSEKNGELGRLRLSNHEAAFQIYTKGKKIRNNHQIAYKKRQVLELSRNDLIQDLQDLSNPL